MASAKQQAINQLGKENDYIGLNALNNERTNAQNVYNTNVNALQNAYNTLLQTAENNKQQANEDFTSGRGTIETSNYMNNRGVTGADLSNRGLSSGFKQLSKYGSVIQNNKAKSNLANTYYKSLEDIQGSIDAGTNDYNINLETAKNNLNAALANIATREANARNDYKKQVAALAEQIQARLDANANAANYNKLVEQQLKNQKEQLDRDYKIRLAELYSKQVGNNPTIDDVYKYANQYMKDTGEKDFSKALNFLNDYNVINITALTTPKPTTVTTTQKLKPLTNNFQNLLGSTLVNGTKSLAQKIKELF